MSILNESSSKPLEIPVEVVNRKTINDPRTNTNLKKYASFQVVSYENTPLEESDNDMKNKETRLIVPNFDNKLLFDLIDSIKSIPCVITNHPNESDNLTESLLAEVPVISPVIPIESASSASILKDICNKFKNVEDEKTTCLKLKRNTKLEKILERRNGYYLNEENFKKMLNKSLDATNDDEKKNLVISSLKSLMNYDFCKNSYKEKDLKKNNSSKSLHQVGSFENDRVSNESIDLYCDLDLDLTQECNTEEEEKKGDILIDNNGETNKSNQSKSELSKKTDLKHENEIEKTEKDKDQSRRHNHEKRSNNNRDSSRYERSKHKENNYSNSKTYSSNCRSSSRHNDHKKRKRSPDERSLSKQKKNNDHESSKHKENDHFNSNRSSSSRHNDYTRRKSNKYSKY